jgi:hypothetical protein
MPRRGFQVRSAIFAPPGMEISISKSAVSPASAASSVTASVIILRGTGLIAGSPIATGRPGKVTVPTPSPAVNVTPAPAAPRRTLAIIRAPWVTSGSSPASLTMPANAKSGPSSSRASAKAGRSPRGRPVRSAVAAARVAAVAQAPVVQPRRKALSGFRAGLRAMGPL